MWHAWTPSTENAQVKPYTRQDALIDPLTIPK